MKDNSLENFGKTLVDWNKDIDRNMPWEGEKDPYLIWLSEIILQQTRVEQGLPYYNKFKSAYPNVCTLANAAENEVMRMWQGLGYYSRCRNLIHTAKTVCYDLNGSFPKSYKELLTLKGIGPYTAAAMASFAFGEKSAVVDGNVKRVVSRYFGLYDPIDIPAGQKAIEELTQSAINLNKSPSDFNQAIMNFGALVCKPKQPKCKECPLHQNCSAYNNDLVNILPIKSKRIQKRDRFFIYLHVTYQDQLLLDQRKEKDIWQNLFQLPLIEQKGFKGKITKAINNELFEHLKTDQIFVDSLIGPYKQLLTHQRINAYFLNISLNQQIDLTEKGYLWIDKDSLEQYAFPKIILDYFQSSKQQSLNI